MRNDIRWVIWLVVVNVFWVLALTGLFVRDQIIEKDQADERRQENCILTIERDEAYERIERNIWIKVVDSVGGTPEDADAAVAFIAEQYDTELPAPATCAR